MPFAPAPAPLGSNAASMKDRWANLWKAKTAKVAVGPPSQTAAPAPAAPMAHASALAPSGPNEDTLLSQVLDGMAEEEAFEELFRAALTPIDFEEPPCYLSNLIRLLRRASAARVP